MDLLSLLLGSLTSSSSVNSLSGKTGLSSKQIQKLVAMAIPILLKAMTSNASSSSGATSLLGALMQHTNKRSFAEQIEEADVDDGQRILGHILGNNSNQVVNQLAAQNGLSANQVNTVLANLAPALLSGISAASQAGKPGGSGDFGSLLSMFGGAQAKPQQVQQLDLGSLSGMLNMFGGAQPQPQPQQQSGGLVSGLLNMLGGSQPQPQQQANISVIDGTDLLSSLFSLMK